MLSSTFFLTLIIWRIYFQLPFVVFSHKQVYSDCVEHAEFFVKVDVEVLLKSWEPNWTLGYQRILDYNSTSILFRNNLSRHNQCIL